ncbi:carbohydrate esterase family 1 protein [Sporormia fimetaria CBS 119925]|uniref:Carboxylic ester hydrolase n=1 Tax=Sporormia fimetaria CBS 119925 TaxID=1340428 RepID=A0A6A6UV89_9PLEO|nr:carbohydrate esterase family 1 protein [Sporormia fimetaria CBS 119925]
MLLSTTLSILSVGAAYAQGLSSTLTQVKDFGPNPRNVSMYIYIPKKLAAKPPILVVPHWCHDTAQRAFQYRPYASESDKYGFISIYPDSPNKADQCWDVSSKDSLTHEGGGDALGIVSMVRWALKEYNADKDRVFVTGTSSGAMMTNVLLGSYPDVFAAGSAWAGVPFGCYAADGYGVWSDACATGKIVKSGSEWAEMVENAYPGYTGFRPKLQTFHGTADDIVYPQNLKEQVKQWTAVFNVSETPTDVTKDTPLLGWTRYRYGDKLEAYEAAGVPHDIPNQADVVMDFFDLRCTGDDCYGRNEQEKSW